MLESLLGYSVPLLLLLMLSAFFSSSETALFSLSGPLVKQMAEKTRKGLLAQRLLRKPRRLLATILIGNTIVNMAFAAISAVVASITLGRFLSERWIIVAETVVASIVLLVLGEVAPKTYAVQNAHSLALRSAPVLSVLSVILGPIVAATGKLMDLLAGAYKGPVGMSFLSIEQLRLAVEMGEEEGLIEEHEERMIEGAFSFAELAVEQIMVPREKVVAFEVSGSVRELIEVVKKSWRSRIPIFKGDLDSVVGVIHAKDIIRFAHHTDQEPKIERLMKRPCVVPRTKKIGELLRELQKERVHMAIVVDEYGRTLGIVTMEDILEELVGEIHDEYDRDTSGMEWSDEMHLVVSGSALIGDVARALGLGPVPWGRRTVQDAFRAAFHGKLKEGVCVLLGRMELVAEETKGSEVTKVKASAREGAEK